MAYTRSWSDTTPPGSQAANTIDDEIRNLRVDIHERMTDLVPDWTAATIAKMGCKAYLNAATQSITTATLTAVTLDSESFDTSTLHDNAVNNSRITIPTNGNKGIWRFHASVAWAAAAGGQRELYIRKNGGGGALQAVSVFAPSATLVLTQDVSCLVLGSSLSVGDYFEAVVLQSSGGNLNVNGGAIGPITTFFDAIQIL